MSTADTRATSGEGGIATPGTQRFAEWVAAHPSAFPLGLLLLTCALVAMINPAFLQIGNVYDLLRASVVTGLFALGVMVVLSSGGLDVSFTAIGALVMYVITRYVIDHAPDMPMAPILVAGLVGGCLLGVINGVLVNLLRAPALIITIATQYAFRGFLLTFIGTSLVMNIPASMSAFNDLTLVQGVNADGQRVRVPAYFLVFAAAAVVSWLMLNKTLIGRAVYATGARPEIAARLGFNVARVRVFAFAWAGALAGLAGILHVVSNRLANPFDLAGNELTVIAAVVIGGARITGGTGTVGGTISGVLLITLVGSVLIQIGVPSIWRTAVIGAFIIAAGIFYAWVDRTAGRS